LWPGAKGIGGGGEGKERAGTPLGKKNYKGIDRFNYPLSASITPKGLKKREGKRRRLWERLAASEKKREVKYVSLGGYAYDQCQVSKRSHILMGGTKKREGTSAEGPRCPREVVPEKERWKTVERTARLFR